MPVYVVRKGKKPGIYNTWEECKEQVIRFSGAEYRKCGDNTEAEEYLNGVSKVRSPTPKSTKSKFHGAFAKTIGNSVINELCTKSKTTKISVSSLAVNSSTGNEQSFTTVYTDGCCLSNGQKESRAGYGVYWEDNHPWNVSEHLDGPPTNNRAELMGSITAMEIALLNGISDLEIKTDSQYTIDAATKYIQNWKKQNWIKKLDSTPVLNKDLMEKLDNLQQQLNVKWTYVKGHSNDRGNDAADKLAKAGATKV